MLPDIPLLEIIGFYEANGWIEAWYTLVHVCQNGESGFRVTASPEFANLLQIHNTGDEDTTVDVWPPVPIIIVDYNLKASGVDGTCAALEHKDRIHEVDLNAIRNS
jgi:hypothetical protein